MSLVYTRGSLGRAWSTRLGVRRPTSSLEFFGHKFTPPQQQVMPPASDAAEEAALVSEPHKIGVFVFYCVFFAPQFPRFAHAPVAAPPLIG